MAKARYLTIEDAIMNLVTITLNPVKLLKGFYRNAEGLLPLFQEQLKTSRQVSRYDAWWTVRMLAASTGDIGLGRRVSRVMAYLVFAPVHLIDRLQVALLALHLNVFIFWKG